jgi:quercetin dioxygenase-like cupin family protein
MFYKADASGYREALDGIVFKALVHGEKTLLSEFRLKEGAEIPPHQHPHEQTGYLVRGRLSFVIGEERAIVEAGDSWCIPGGVEHGARALEDTVVVEVFSPVREEYLP